MLETKEEILERPRDDFIIQQLITLLSANSENITLSALKILNILLTITANNIWIKF